MLNCRGDVAHQAMQKCRIRRRLLRSSCMSDSTRTC
jgi:hypothetical protein